MNYSEKLNAVIPGGAHTYSRGDDQFPANAPQILSHGKGAYVWDTNGKKYLDYGLALRAITLGYSNDEVNQAAFKEIERGNNLTRASLIELEAAEAMVDLVDGADMVKFAKNGSTVTSAAIKLARAYTGRTKIARCSNHPFFSYDDWFIGSTAMDKGVPEAAKANTLLFEYNNLQSLEQIFSENENQIAAIILEPATTEEPKDEFLHKVQTLCKKHGAVFILDEMITGFRWSLQGAQGLYKITPDLSTFGKGMANGFSVAALVGKKEIMNIGGIKEEGAERVFLISTTHGAEMCGLGALKKTIEIYKRDNVVDHLWNYGEQLISKASAISKELGLSDSFYFNGVPCAPNYVTKDKQGNISLPLRTLFSQEMISNGVLMPWVSLCYAHGDQELKETLIAIRKSLEVYSKALESDVFKYLDGPVIKPVFRKTN